MMWIIHNLKRRMFPGGETESIEGPKVDISALYQLLTIIKKPGGLRVSFYKTDVSCGCQGDLRLAFVPTDKEKLSKAEIVEAIESGEAKILR